MYLFCNWQQAGKWERRGTVQRQKASKSTPPLDVWYFDKLASIWTIDSAKRRKRGCDEGNRSGKDGWSGWSCCIVYLEFGTVVNSWSEFEKMKAEDPKERPSAAEAPKTEEVRTDRGGCVYFEVILKSFHLRFRLEKTASLTAAEKTRKGISPISLHRPEPNELCKPRATFGSCKLWDRAKRTNLNNPFSQPRSARNILLALIAYQPCKPHSTTPFGRRWQNTFPLKFISWKTNAPSGFACQLAVSPLPHLFVSCCNPCSDFCVGSCAGHVTWGNYTVPNPKRCPLLLYSSCQLIVLNLAVWQKWKSCREWSM